MVGVRRSRGCANCRSRKKGCDGKKPSCSRCISLGLECGGYQRSYQFVFQNCDTPPAAPTVQERKASAAAPDTSPSQLPWSVVRSAFHEQAISLFWEDFADPKNGTPIARSALPTTLKWLPAAIKIAQDDPSLLAALDAISFARVGRTSNNKDLVLTSLNMYGSAVREVRKGVSAQDGMLGDSTLATVMLLALFELYESASGYGNGHAWVAHMRGALHLIKLRDRKNFQSDIGNDLFVACQSFAFINSIGSLFMGVKFPIVPVRATESTLSIFPVLEPLVDILALSNKLRGCSTINNTLVSDIEELVDSCNYLESKLNRWYRMYSFEHNDSLYTFEPSTIYAEMSESSPYRIFPTYVNFASLDIAEQIANYWTALFLLYAAMFFTKVQLTRLFSADPDFVRVVTPLANVDINPHDQQFAEGHRIATLILQSAEYFVRPETGVIGANILGFPIAMARGCFEYFGYYKELGFLVDVIYKMFETLRKVPLETFLGDFAEGRELRILEFPTDGPLYQNEYDTLSEMGASHYSV